MAALKALAALALLAASPAAAADSTARWSGLIREASARFGLPERWIRQVMRVESAGRTAATSRAGAMGLMQLMPDTWSEMRSAHGLGGDPYDPRDNVLAGAAYLRAMYDRFGYPGLFAAYNAGPARYSAHLATGQELPGETRAYLDRVAGRAPRPVRVASATLRSNPSGLFALGATASPAASGAAMREDPLFAIRR